VLDLAVLWDDAGTVIHNLPSVTSSPCGSWTCRTGHDVGVTALEQLAGAELSAVESSPRTARRKRAF
jgi:hypothetical protein